MVSNLDRFKKNLKELIQLGEQLQNSMQRDLNEKAFLKEAEKHFQGTELEVFMESLPNFNSKYEEWYSESLALLKQVLPDRVADFLGLYEKPKGRKRLDNSNYVMQDYLQGTKITEWDGEIRVSPQSALVQFSQQLSIVRAAERRFESSLFDIKQLVQADLFDSDLEAAQELLKKKFIRAAGAVAGVVLEKHLKQVCLNHSIKIPKKNPTLSDLNELLKTNSVIDIPEWRHISMLADIRNLCDHNKHKEPTEAQVQDLIGGTAKVIKTIF